MVVSGTTGIISHIENPTTNGQLLISKSDGTNPIWASLTAGANISITPGANSISIAASGVIGISEVTADTQLVVNKILEINQVSTCYIADVDAIKSINNLIF